MKLLKILVEQGYIVRFERHPSNPTYIAVSLSKEHYTQRGTMPLDQFNEDSVCGLLVEARRSLDMYLKLRKG